MNLKKTDDGVICKFYGAPIWIESNGKLVIDFKDSFRAVDFCQYIMEKYGIVNLLEIKKESNFNGK